MSARLASSSPQERYTDSQAECTNDQFTKALHAVLEDESFKFQSKAAMEAREAAVSMLDWATRQENLPAQTNFLQQLQDNFKSCLKFLNPASINRIRLWQSFFLLRSSSKFIEMWKDFLLMIKVKPTPTLYQHLTMIM